MDLRITADERVWRGRQRALDAAIDELKARWNAALEKDPTATLVLTLESEPAPPLKKGPYG